MKCLPEIHCPVYGILSKYTLKLSDSINSKEIKYMCRGVWYYGDTKEVTVVSIAKTTEHPNHITIVYTVGDNKLGAVLANDIVSTTDTVAELFRVREQTAEDESHLYALHHASSMYIRQANHKTFIFKATGMSKTIRGNAYYKILDVNRIDGTKLEFTVTSNTDENKFTMTCENIAHGAWHRVPGTLCPVPGMDPSEE